MEEKQAKAKIHFNGRFTMTGLIILGWFIYAGTGGFPDKDRNRPYIKVEKAATTIEYSLKD